MAQFDMSRMQTLKVQRKRNYLQKLEFHAENFRKAMTETKNARARVVKGLERYFVDKKRI